MPASSSLSLKIKLALAGIVILLSLFPIGVRPLFVPDEYRYAEIPREMVSSGDWVVPRLCGLRYFEKPPFGYWLTALSFRVFGFNPFAFRFPGVFSLLLCSFLIYLLTITISGEERSAFLAALVFLSFGLTRVMASTNLPDIPLTCFLTLALLCIYRADQADTPFQRRSYLLLLGLAGGGAFLSKGFLGLLLPGLVMVPYLIWVRRLKELGSFLLLPLLGALLVALPWAAEIGRAEPQFWHYFFWQEHIQRFIAPGGRQHAEAFWFFLPILAGGALPWALLIPPAVKGLRAIGRKNPGIGLTLCGVIFPLLFFSASRGKLATYIFPCFPPLAILFALGLKRALAEGKDRYFNLIARALSFLFAGIALAGGILYISVGRELFAPGAAAVIVLALLGGALLAAASARTRRPFGKLSLFALAPILLFSLGQTSLPYKVLENKSPGALLLRNRGRIPPSGIILVTHDTGPPVSWYLRRADAGIIFFENPGELRYGLSFPDGRRRLVDRNWLKKLLKKGRFAGGVITAILKKSFFDEINSILPPPDYRDETENYILFQYHGRRRS